MSRYQAFGLVLESPLDFPELLVGTGKPDVDIREILDDSLADGEGAEFTPNPDRLRLEFLQAGTFLVEAGVRITFRRREGTPNDVVRLFLLGSCMGCILQQRGFVVLHGNAVSTDGETCRIIVGHSGAGKSTAAAWHYRAGARILADDLCAIDFAPDGRPRVTPGYPQIKLWKTSADLLGVSITGLRRIHPQHDKFAIPLGAQFMLAPLLLAEVIELAANHTQAEPWKGMSKVDCLMRHSYRHAFVEKMDRTPEYLKKILALAACIEVRTGVRMALGAPATTVRRTCK